MNVRKFLFGFLILWIISFATFSHAVGSQEYSLGAKEGTVIILEVKTIMHVKLEETLGDDWSDAIMEDADEVGKKQKIIIEEVDDDGEFDMGVFGTQDGFEYKIKLWEWTSENFEEEPDEEDYSLGWFENPDDLNDVYEFLGGFSGEMPFVPKPVKVFLEEVKYKREWESKENCIIHRSSVDGEGYIRTYAYDIGDGFLSSFTIKNSANLVIYKVGRGNTIAGYDIPVLLGFSGICILGVIILFIKKNK